MKDYDKYFIVTETPKRGLHIVPKGDAIRERQRDFGYFVLLTNGIKNPVEAIKLYRVRDLIEKLCKPEGTAGYEAHVRLLLREFRRKTLCPVSGPNLPFLHQKQMDEKGLYKKYTMQTLLDDLDIIELYQQPGRAHHLSEITKKQIALYDAMGVPFPK